MNMQQIEIKQAIRQVCHGPAVIRYTCLICKAYLNDWDVKAGKAVCWKCRKTCWPKPQQSETVEQPKQPRLVPLRDGLYAIAID